MHNQEDAKGFDKPLNRTASDEGSRMYEASPAMQADELSLVRHLQRIHDPKGLALLRRLRDDSSQ